MVDANGTNGRAMAVQGLVLALGMVLSGWALGAQIKATRLADRYVSVRGLSERDVKSDLALWSLNYKEAGDDLEGLYSKTEADKKVIVKFLEQQGIQPSEIVIGVVGVTDLQANPNDGDKKPPHRYIVDQGVTVQTSRVDQVELAQQKTILLMQQGIVLSGGNEVTYKFTGLNSIKPDMITEATRNARAAAERFAADSGSQVGRIRQGTQGVFAILAQGAGVDTGESDSSGGADGSIMKTVRVVTDVDYYLEN
jgi:hypothetical protein